MKINMWMIANRLSALEPELHIPEDAPADLLSARRAYATQCAYVYQRGKDVICNGGEKGGYIVFRDMACDQIFEMVQFTFDFYREWQEMLIEATEQMDYRKMIDQSWTVFHNPIMLLDASINALAMSEQYGEDDVNYDWQYLSRLGHSAVSVMQFLMEEGKRHEYYMNGSARIYYFSNPEINGRQLSVTIYYHGKACGRMNVVEKDRILNPGDVFVANYLVKYLAMVLGRLNEQSISERVLLPGFTKMMLNHPVTSSEIRAWKEYVRWSEGDCIRVSALKFADPDPDIHDIVSICNLLQCNIRHCIAVQVENTIAFSFKEFPEEVGGILGVVRDLIGRFGLKAGVSLPVDHIEKLYLYYRQALAAIDYGMLYSPGAEMFTFYDYAIEYMLEARSEEEVICACHPEIVRMWVSGEPGGGEKVDTLRAWLDHERSLLHTANALFLHRNTLVYRLRKILDSMDADMNDAYTRNYIKISIRALRLNALREKRG